MEIRLPYNWKPRPYQENAWRAREAGIKRICLVWHRRAGKDDFALHTTAVEAHKRVGTYWHMLPEYGQARKAIWEAINPHTGIRRINEAFPEVLRESWRETDMHIQFKNGSTWNVVGSDNYDSLVGSPPIGVVFSEWALAKPQAWAYLRPILAENDGWAIFIYTPRGPNHGQDTYNLARTSPGEWFGELLTVDDTGAIGPERLVKERREYHSEWGPIMGEALFRQEYYCSFEAAIVGSFYGDLIAAARKEGRIGNVPPDPHVEVGTMWDLGYTDSTAIWFFQLVGHQVRFIDYYEAHNVGLEHYAAVLRTKAEQRRFVYSKQMCFFPHDVEVHELTTGESRRAMLWRLGIPVTTVPKHSVMDGISLVRRNFHRYWFDLERTEKGLKALTMYRREWDENKRTLDPAPVHDWTSHASDALRTGQAMLPDYAPLPSLDGREARYRRSRRPDRPRYSRMGH